MKKKFSTKWKASKQPKKQRKYLAKAPINIKRKQLSANLSKEIRKKYGRRSMELKKGDKVKIMRGKYKGKSGKIDKILTKRLKIYVDGIQIKKSEGSKINIPLKASNLQIIELNTDDKKRMKRKPEIKQESKK